MLEKRLSFTRNGEQPMSRISISKIKRLAAYPWIVRRYKNRIVIEIIRKRIPAKGKAQATIPPDCQPEIW